MNRNRNIRLTLAYDGTRYDGWQKQGNTENTIQGKIEKLLEKMTGEPVEVQASGRTDAGVHAKGQVANFHTSVSMPVGEMKQYINRYLPEDIAVLKAEEVSERFHSRFHAKSKTYSYRIQNSGTSNVFERQYMYQMAEVLDINAMRMAAGYLTGTHDFKSFCGNRHMKKSTVRSLYLIDIRKKEDEVCITYTGNGFLQYMVRIMTGTLIEVGLGKRRAKEIVEILEAKNREQAGFTAPAKGLCLMEVCYED